MPFTARYVFSIEDYATLLGIVRSQRRLMPWLVRIMFLVIISSFFAVPYFFGGEHEPATSVWDLAINLGPIFILYAVWELLIFRSFLTARLFFKQCPIAGQTLSYELGEKSVSWTRDRMRGQFDWPAFEAVVVKPAAVVLIVDKRQGIVLSARAFASQAEFEAAANFARAKIAAQKSAAGA